MTSGRIDPPLAPVRHVIGQLYVSPIVETVVIAIGYYLAARLSLKLQVQPEQIAVFWPASGLAAGALIVLGSAAWLRVAGSGRGHLSDHRSKRRSRSVDCCCGAVRAL